MGRHREYMGGDQLTVSGREVRRHESNQQESRIENEIHPDTPVAPYLWRFVCAFRTWTLDHRGSQRIAFYGTMPETRVTAVLLTRTTSNAKQTILPAKPPSVVRIGTESRSQQPSLLPLKPALHIAARIVRGSDRSGHLGVRRTRNSWKGKEAHLI